MTATKSVCKKSKVNVLRVKRRVSSLKTISKQSLTRTKSKATTTSTLRKRTRIPKYGEITHSDYSNLKITIDDIPNRIQLDVHIHPVNVGNAWLCRIYRKYENDLWQRRPRSPASYGKKWYFECLLCQRTFCEFRTMRYHLNVHLELYPYACMICDQQYQSRGVAVRHLKRVHQVYANFKKFIAI